MTEISWTEALRIAVAREEAAAATYYQWAEQVKDKAVKEMLIDLAKEEENHKRKLEGLTPDQVRAFSTKSIDLALTDNLLAEPFSADLPLQDLLIRAIKKEKEAAAFYSQLSQRATNAEVKNLFLYLEEQEKSHKLRLELEYERLFLPED